MHRLIAVLLLVILLLPVSQARADDPLRGNRGVGRDDLGRELRLGPPGRRALAVSGDPRAAAVIEALHDGNLFANADQALFIKQPDGELRRCRDRRAGADVPADASSRCASTTPSAARSTPRWARCACSRPTPATRRDAAEAVFKARDPAALPALDRALAQETDAGGEARACSRRAPPRCCRRPTPAEADRLAAVATSARPRRPRRAQPAGLAVRPDPAGRRCRRRRRRRRSTAILQTLEPAAERLSTGSASARCCCWPPPGSRSPSASWASSTWRTARWS